MSTEESVVNYVLRNEFNLRKIPIRENATFKFGRQKYVIDFYLQEQSIGIVTINWKRTIPTNKLLQLEQLITSLNLKKLVLICNSVSTNARDFLARRDIPIQIIHLNEIIYKEKKIEDLIASY
ncbi:MAG: hypothetical protein ACTSQF_04440 [Candidatus Heimdallarchaeaceae archaeon]